jgi:putative DNA primase/helicase
VRAPALVAPFRSIDTDEITAVHRIALDRDGRKLGRRMFGIVFRAAIKLDPSGASLAIGEGLETAMAARQLGITPAWALGSVGSISSFPLVDGVDQLIILGETGHASACAVRFCGKRWREAGRRVRTAMPTIGNDMNDALMARGFGS